MRSLRRRAVPALLLASLLSACAGDDPGEGSVPLLPGAPHELLTEEGVLGPPSSDGPNRLTTGWRPGRRSGPGEAPESFRTAGPRAGLGFVTLTGEARTLTLDLETNPHPGREPVNALTAGGHVEVTIDGRPAGVAPVADPLTVAIPAGLAPGRHTIELTLPDRGRHPLEVRAVRMRRVDEGGGAEVGDGSIDQSGPSLLDLYARPGAGAVLIGTLCPAGTFTSTIGLTATLTGAGGEEIAAWEGTEGVDRLFDRLRGCRRLELGPVPDDGPVRLRLAAGPGAEGSWSGLGWLGEEAARPGDAAPSPLLAEIEPPKLLVLYLPDALRADAVGHLGGADVRGGNPTPVLDRLAGEGHAFRRHRTAAPNTLLSLRQLFTGRPVVDGGSWDALGAGAPTLAESLRSAGWRTGLFSGNTYLSERYGLGRGFGHVSEEALYQGPPAESDEREAITEGWVNRNAEQVHDAALAWLDTLGDGEPIFLHLQTIHPHGPYAPPADLESRFAPSSSGSPGSELTGANRTLIDLARGRRRASADDRERLRGLYRAGLAYNDAELERFLAALAERVPPEETVVVVSSDHGEELFDHGGVLHGYTLYEEQLRVPLVVWGPGRVPPGSSDRITDSYDLHATLLEMAGVGAGGGPAPEGGAPRLHFAAADGPPGGAFAVRWGRWKYVRTRGTPGGWAIGQGPARSWRREYLFDLASDPGETRNLSGAPGHEVVEGWLRTTLREWAEARRAESRSVEPPETEPEQEQEPERLTPEERERLRALGYVD